jgi:hypothetical protein
VAEIPEMIVRMEIKLVELPKITTIKRQPLK